MNRLPALFFALLLTAVIPDGSAVIRAQSAGRVCIVMPGRPHMLYQEKRTGCRLVEVARAWNAFRNAGLEVDFICRNGGAVVFDSTGMTPDDPAIQRMSGDTTATNLMKTAIPSSAIQTDLYSAVFFVGGHAALWDFTEDGNLSRFAAQLYERGGILATVGHGAAVLLNATLSDGTPLARGKRLACATDEEEESDGFVYDIPYLLETALRRLGAIHFRDSRHVSNVVVEDRLITGQNSESARETAEAVVGKLDFHEHKDK